MLSVNIPVYNIEVSDLVEQLVSQADLLGIDYEIRIYDDCSDKELRERNRHLAQLSQIIYKEMPVNLGRSAIRNKMGSDSEKDYLLFIDADSKLVADSYLENYVKHATPGCVLCGGTQYAVQKPDEQEKMLRWVYGRKREAISADQRNLRKGFIITSNNFLIDRQIFLKNQFREDIGPYGHEDTLLGYDLYKNDINPLHLDNPVEHTGLENSEVYISKTRKALENLLFISQEKLAGASDFSKRVRFLNQYVKITRVCPHFIIRLFFNLFKKQIESNLTGKKPFLLWFDLYKLGYFSTLNKAK